MRALVVALLVVLAAPALVDAQFGRGRPGGRPGGQGGPRGSQDDDGAKAGKYGVTAAAVMEALAAGEGRLALEAYEQAGRDAEAGANPSLAVRAYSAGSLTALRLGLLAQTVALGTRATSLAPHADNVFALRAALSAHVSLAQAYRGIGDVARARSTFEDGIAFSRSAPAMKFERGLAVSRAALLRALSQFELAQGDRAKALAHVEHAASILQAIPLQSVSDQLRKIVRTHLANTQMQIGRIALAGKRLDDAAAAFSRAGQFARDAGLSDLGAETMLLSAHVALERGHAQDALKLLGEATAPAQQSGRRALLVELDRLSASAYEKLGKLDDALAAVRSAITRIEDSRGELADPGQRASFLEQRQGIYQSAVRLALRGGKADEAFALAERSRARAFLDLLGSQTVLSKGRTRALVQEETLLRARLADAAAAADEATDEERIDAAKARERAVSTEREYKAFLERVRKDNSEQASMMSVEPVTLAEIQSLLPEGTTLLEYLVGARDLVVWIVDRHRMEVRRTVGDRAALAAEVRDFRTAIANQAPLAEIEARAEALHRRLVGPAQNAIRGTRLLIVPHDVLHYLPFGALRTPDGRWLVDAYGLSTVPSASVLKFLAGKGTQSSDRVLAVGNPDVGPALALRYAEREVRAIHDRFGSSATVLTRADATESQAKQLGPQAGVLHFAVHGELNEQDPMASALLLTPGAGNDGRLEVREIFGLDLNASLVVLSACETGLGALSRGDELVGLQRAFLYAGTPAVVTTLWKVDDRASYLLMRAFYENLAAKGPAEALRTAQRRLMVDFPHPFAWAAFGLTGASR